jgi:hypothetical protein
MRLRRASRDAVVDRAVGVLPRDMPSWEELDFVAVDVASHNAVYEVYYRGDLIAVYKAGLTDLAVRNEVTAYRVCRLLGLNNVPETRGWLTSLPRYYKLFRSGWPAISKVFIPRAWN